MLLVAAVWLYASFLGIVYGFSALRLLRRMAEIEPSDYLPPLPVVFIIGLAVIAALIGCLSLFIRINGLAHLLLIAGAVFAMLRDRVAYRVLFVKIFRSARGVPRPLIGLGFIFCILLLIWSVAAPRSYDTGLYHAQTVRWIEEYKAVPGLGNLHARFAYNSSWLLLSALFDLSLLRPHSFHALGGLLMLFFFLFVAGDVRTVMKGRFAFVSLVKVGFFFFALLALTWYPGAISSFNSDIPLMVAVFFVMALFLERHADSGRRIDFVDVAAMVIGIVYVVTIKLAGLPLAILAFVLLWKESHLRAGWRSVIVLSAISGALLFPWIVRSIILSGYPLYPFPYLDLCSVDWKIPFGRAAEEARIDRAWARLPGRPSDTVLAMSIPGWIGPWFRSLHSVYQVWLLTLCALIGVHGLRYFGICRLPIDWFLPYRRHKALLVTVGVGTLFWFLMAPDPRFGYSFLAGFVLMLGAPFMSGLSGRKGPARCMQVILVGAIIISGYAGIRELMRTPAAQIHGSLLLFPADFKEVAVRKAFVGNIEVAVPIVGDQCWYKSFPCIPGVPEGVVPRGRRLEDGFRMESRASI